jgi:hypothetical protein
MNRSIPKRGGWAALAILLLVGGVAAWANRPVHVDVAGAATADVVPAPVARLVIRNESSFPIRGRVRSGPTSFAFLVPVSEVRELQLGTGEAVIQVDVQPPVIRRVMLEQGETEEFVYDGGP